MSDADTPSARTARRAWLACRYVLCSLPTQVTRASRRGRDAADVTPALATYPGAAEAPRPRRPLWPPRRTRPESSQ